jgi:hypothetical protein
MERISKKAAKREIALIIIRMGKLQEDRGIAKSVIERITEKQKTERLDQKEQWVMSHASKALLELQNRLEAFKKEINSTIDNIER